MSIERWIYVAPDQLTVRVGPLSRSEPESTGVIMVESLWWAKRRPHHKQKLAFVFANMRHFANELRDTGFEVRYEQTADPIGQTLSSICRKLGCVPSTMLPASRELRIELEALVAAGKLEFVPNEMWLTTTEDFESSQDGPPWRMDQFYGHIRRTTGILMENGRPVGGKYSFDAENRKPWKGSPPAPVPPVFPLDPIKDEVCNMVERLFDQNPGSISRDRLSATAADAQEAWRWAAENALPRFGPYEDAMSVGSSTLFHTLISPLLNIGRVVPVDALEGALHLDIPLQSLEGFVRQLIGWREFVRHVHEATDGFRDVAGEVHPVVSETDDAAPAGLDRGAAPNYLEAENGLPPAFWGQTSGLHCLDTVVEDVLDTGWSHHITRLMILSNMATLLDSSPRQLADWFWDMYIDAWDWVVEPNTLAMGAYALGDMMTTKPYVSGAAYIHRMSDYCSACAFDPKSNCPITRLYWNFLERKREKLDGNHRMALPLASARKRDAREKEVDRAVFDWATDHLANGRTLEPDDIPTGETVAA